MFSRHKIRALANRAGGWIVGPATSLQVRIVLWAGKLVFWWKGWKREPREMDISQVRRVLVLSLDAVGDLVMASGFLRELRRMLPAAGVTLVVSPVAYNLAETCPHVEEVLVYEPGARRLARPFLLPGRALRLASRHLWPQRYDLAIVPRWDVDRTYASFLAFLSGARWRAAYSQEVNARKRQLNSGFDRLFTQVFRGPTLRHEVERNLDVIRFLGGAVREERLEVWPRPEDEAYARGILVQRGAERGEVTLALGPAGGQSNLRQWPIQHFVELGNRLLAQKACARILIVGGPGEEHLGQQLRDRLGPRAINVVGNSLRQMAALLKQCHLYVGTDSGPMHVAVATGIPVVALFGSSCPHRFGPWGKGHAIVWHSLPCSPCSDTYHRTRCSVCIFDRPHCMWEISVEEVEQIVKVALRGQPVKNGGPSAS